jgi:excisionase family DNA binding protein
MTAQQAADYLQVSRETIYRSIRMGELRASRVGRTFRITMMDIDLMIWEIRTGQPRPFRVYTSEEIEEFMRLDELDEETAKIAQSFLSRMDALTAQEQ